ncbi:ankyrin-3-like [Episyrphus balteatus]|uniref:ankyrin-3-like n=1 Tax=Episyrphus balteatus TaxID=286459 RepID=UPI0024858E20|nr:ankyrin-3-like [Episyrphus balteatus]
MTEINRDLHHAVSYGNLEIVRALINLHGIHSSESHGYVLLRESIKLQRKEITKFLLISGSRVNSKRNRSVRSNTPLHFAIQNGDIEITLMLLDHAADINARNESGLSPLLIAIQEKQETIVDILLKRGAILNTCSKGISPLHHAVEMRLCNITEKLLQFGAYVDSKANLYHKKEYTPLHCATENGDLEIVKVLLKKGANVNFKTADGLTSLHLACKTGNVEIIDLLLSSNADINAREHNKLTPLYIAVENSRREAAKLLMDHGAKINDEFDNGKTILSCAVDKRLSLIVNDILQYSPDVNNIINKKSLKTALSKRNGYSEIVENMVKYGFSDNHVDINDTALLHNAIKMGNTKTIEDLINYGLNLTCKKKENCIVLHIAIKHKQFEVAKLLLTHGADVNAKDENKKPPIYYSVYNSDVNMTKLLLSHGANIQKSPELLGIATNKVCKEIIEILLENDVDIEGTDKFGRTALHMCASQEYDVFFDIRKNSPDSPEVKLAKAEIAQILLINGANVNAKTTIGNYTALWLACAKKSINLIEVLLKYEADVNIPMGFTPLHIATESGNETIIEMLLKNNTNVVKSKQENGDTALHIAARRGHKNALQILIKYGADVNLKNNKRDTALHLAAKGNNYEIVSILLKHMSIIDSQNIDGNTPLHIAVGLAKTDYIHDLLNFGSDINILNNNNCTVIDLANDLDYDMSDDFIDEDDDGLEDEERFADREDEKIYILQTLLSHAITLKAVNLYSAKTDLFSFLDDNTLLAFLQEDCKIEIKLLKVDKIAANARLSFYDILTKSIHSLARCVRNEDVVRIFSSDNYKKKFPIYAGIIERNFKKATQRRHLLDSAYGFFKCYFKMPNKCSDQILSYLSNGDLENIKDSWII